MYAAKWSADLHCRHAAVGTTLLDKPELSIDENEWVAKATSSNSPPSFDGLSFQFPWETPVWDNGVNGTDFVPEFVIYHRQFWAEVVLAGHPLRDTLLYYVSEGVPVFDFLTYEFRGKSRESPYRVDAFPGEVFSNRVPPEFEEFVQSEVDSLIARGCLIPWEEVKAPQGPTRPRLIQASSVEPSKPRLICDARPLNACCKHVPFTMDTVARVAGVAEKGCFQGSVDDKSGFHQVLLHPNSWPSFGVRWRDQDFVWSVLPFGWNESPFVYHALSEAKAAYLRSRGVPALAYIDDSWLANFRNSFGAPDRIQWLGAAAAIHLAMTVSFNSGYFTSPAKCDIRPSRVQKYLGIECDSLEAAFRIPAEKLQKMQSLVRSALDTGYVTIQTLERIAGKCTSMAVAIRPASLWTHCMFSQLARKSARGDRDSNRVRFDANPELAGEFHQWLELEPKTHQGPWFKARHFTAALTVGATDASSNAFGGVIRMPHGLFEAGGDFPSDWLPRHINAKEMFALHEVLEQFCTIHPDALRRAQVVLDVDNQSVVHAFRRGRARDPQAHALLIKLFRLQVEYEVWLSLRWVPTAENGVADAITRPSKEEIVRLTAGAFQRLWDYFGEFNVDLMASTESAQLTPGGTRLPFFSRYQCQDSAGVDVFAQDVSVVPGATTRAFGSCFPPPIMVGTVVQHLFECRARAVVLVPDTRPYWYPLLAQGCNRSVLVAAKGQRGAFVWPHHRDGLREYVYAKWGMRAYEVNFSSATP